MALDLSTREDSDLVTQVVSADVTYDTAELQGGMKAGLPAAVREVEDVAGGLDRNEVAELRYMQGEFGAVLQGTTETVDTSAELEVTLSLDSQSPIGGFVTETNADGVETNVGADVDPDHLMTLIAFAGGGFEDSASGVGGGSSQTVMTSDMDFAEHGIAPEFTRHDNLFVHFAGYNFDAQDATLFGVSNWKLIYEVYEE